MTLSMTCEQFEDILPQLLDDDAMPVPPAARLHLEGCVECKTLYDDLTGIRASAASLPPIVPSRDLWAGIEARIRTPVVPLVEGMPARRQRRQVSLRSAAIAAGLLALVNAGVSYGYMYMKRKPVVVVAEQPQMPAPAAMRTAVSAEPLLSLPIRVVAMPPATPRRGSTIVLAANGAGAVPVVDEGPDEPQQQQPRRREQAKAMYDREISQLRAIVDSGRRKLDPATAAVLDRNLRIIDAAIEQCSQALLRDSTSTFLIESLNNVYQTKVKLLRIAAAAASRE
jgi:hypothetical protein